MPTARHQRPDRSTENKLRALMNDWPASWAGERKDKPIGMALVDLMRPFVVYLQMRGFARNTIRRHVNNLWAIGGEIIRDLDNDSKLRTKPAERLLIDAIDQGDAPLLMHATEEEQRSVDATARKLFRYLTVQESAQCSAIGELGAPRSKVHRRGWGPKKPAAAP